MRLDTKRCPSCIAIIKARETCCEQCVRRARARVAAAELRRCVTLSDPTLHASPRVLATPWKQVVSEADRRDFPGRKHTEPEMTMAEEVKALGGLRAASKAPPRGELPRGIISAEQTAEAHARADKARKSLAERSPALDPIKPSDRRRGTAEYYLELAREAERFCEHDRAKRFREIASFFAATLDAISARRRKALEDEPVDELSSVTWGSSLFR